MIKQTTIIQITLTLLLLSSLKATGEEHIEESQRLFYFSKEVITFKNLCEGTEMTAFEAFMPKNMFLYFKQKTSNGVIQDYNAYRLALAEHQQMMTEYLAQLSDKIQTYTDDNLNNYQIDFIRTKIMRITSYINKLVKEVDSEGPDYIFHGAADQVNYTDSFNPFMDRSEEFENLNDNFIFNLHKLIAEAGKLPHIRVGIQPAVCNNIIGSIVDIFKIYLDEDNFGKLTQEKKIFLQKFFTEFSKHDFEDYECDSGAGQKQAKTHLINQIYNHIYDKDLEHFDPSEFGYFLENIIPNTSTVNNEYSSIKKMDHDIVHTFEKFNSLSLDDLRTMFKLRKPISMDFIGFLNNAEPEFAAIDVSINEKETDNVPLEVFTVIYKAYIVSRGSLPEDQAELLAPIDGIEEDEELPNLAKSLYSFLLRTPLFDQVAIDDPDSENKIQERAKFAQLLAPITFKKYRLLALTVLLNKFSLNPIEFNNNYVPELLNVLESYNDPAEFAASTDLAKYYPEAVIDMYHNKQLQSVFDSFNIKKSDLKNKIFKTFDNKSKDKKKQRKARDTMIETIEEDAGPEINNIVEITKINNPKEAPMMLAKKAQKLADIVENVDDDVDKFAATTILNRALQSQVLNAEYKPEDEPFNAKKKILAKVLLSINNKLINDLLIKIRSPGLYQFLTYISTQSNMNDLKILGRSQKSSSDPDRANNFTLDKLIFLHKWYEVSKKGCTEKLKNGQELSKEEKIINNLHGPSAHFANSLTLTYGQKTTRGVVKVYQHLLLTSMFIEYFPSLKFMAELIPLFERFTAIEHENPTERIHENYKEMFIYLYNIVLDIRSDDLEMKGRTSMTVFLEKLHEIRDDLLEAHMSKKNEEVLTARHSMTYKDVARVSYFVYYHISLDLQNSEIFEEQIAGNFGINELMQRDLPLLQERYNETDFDVETFLHNRYDFGNVAFEMSNFLTYMYLHDRDFIRNLCVVYNPGQDESNIKLNGFCAQSMIFLTSMEFLSRSESGDFEAWIANVFGNETFKNYVLNNKGIFYASIEMINRESNMLRTLHSERLSKIIDDEQARTIKLSDLRDKEEEFEPSLYEQFFMLDPAKDKSWLINYMFVNFERAYQSYESHLYTGFNTIIQNEPLDDYIGAIKKIHYSDLELEAKSFNVEAFRVMLLFAQTFENFEKIADYLIERNRSSLLIYLKKESDGHSELISELHNRVIAHVHAGNADNRAKLPGQVVDTIKELFNQYSDVLIERCESGLQAELTVENFDDFGDILDMLGESSEDRTETIYAEIDREELQKTKENLSVESIAEKDSSRLMTLRKGIKAKAMIQINGNSGEGVALVGNAPEETFNFINSEISNRNTPSQQQIMNITMNGIVSSLADVNKLDQKVKINSNSPRAAFANRKDTLMKGLKNKTEERNGNSVNIDNSQNSSISSQKKMLLI